MGILVGYTEYVCTICTYGGLGKISSEMRTHYICKNLKDKDMVTLMKGGKLELPVVSVGGEDYVVNIYHPHHGLILTVKEVDLLRSMEWKEAQGFLFKKLNTYKYV
jgi:hypothetical protein